MRNPLPGVLSAGAMLVGLLCAGVVPAIGQPVEVPEDLSPLKYFVGRWQGTSEGQPGNGSVEREYRSMLRSRVIELSNRSVYPPQTLNPKGETHEDLGLFSFDRGI